MSTIRKALVIDDDDDVLRLCKVSLQTFTSWTVAVAGSAEDAVRAARREAPDVILLDVRMPGEGGLSILCRLKSCDATASIPVVLITADPTGIDPRGARDAAGVIAKPFEPSELPDQLARAVRVRGPSTAPAPEPDPLAALHAGYARGLPRRLRRLAAALRAWRRAPEDARARLHEEARTLAHRLRGTASSYGYAEIGDATGRVEDALRRASGAGTEAGDVAWDQIASALREAEALAGDAIRRLDCGEARS
jgi:CheY-like chemotaxis protein